MVNWPCMLKLDGDDELIYLGSANDLSLECAGLIWTNEDFVIDSQGKTYLFLKQDSDIKLVDRLIPIGLDEVTQLIQAHQFSQAEVCLTKIHFSSITEAVKSLEYLTE